MYYLFINENQIEKYNGEILKRYVGNSLVTVISNPTEKDFKRLEKYKKAYAYLESL